MNTLPLPSPRPGIRFVLYPGHEALHITDELQHLELVGARVPFRTGGDNPDCSSWLESCTAESGFRLVTMSMDGLLVGFAAGVVAEGLVDLRHLVIASTVRTRHPDLVGLLVEVFVDSAEQPWADVLIPRACPALGHLLQAGWCPSLRTGPAVAASGDLGESLRLTAAAGR
ncbi:hypothetical protein [Arsenicicoccus dermatophilus]|uniref:hypothetical protein n=1 Tax=Arsenicicoccus dermatophilus TaxID=1076331 RepID=UPI001F4D1A47|nr:hypothetical protein [Arsenicicoccus dermatophilus]MCH8614172.1 hypothetical protein [Arsenicicoccus dermatophilus]